MQLPSCSQRAFEQPEHEPPNAWPVEMSVFRRGSRRNATRDPLPRPPERSDAGRLGGATARAPRARPDRGWAAEQTSPTCELGHHQPTSTALGLMPRERVGFHLSFGPTTERDARYPVRRTAVQLEGRTTRVDDVLANDSEQATRARARAGARARPRRRPPPAAVVASRCPSDD